MSSASVRRMGRSIAWLPGLVAALYCFCFALYQSHRRLMVLDELFAWNIISDPSWRHALYTWNHGVDGGGFFFYATLWPIVRLSRGSVLLPRLLSAAAYVLAGVTWWRALTRFIESRWAAVGVLLVWVSSEMLLTYTYIIRFYALYLLLSALAVYAFLRVAEGSWSRSVATIVLFVVNACLVLTHMIGIVYSGLTLGAWLLCVIRRRHLWAFGLPVVAGWGTLVLCRKAIYYSSLNYGYPGMPHPRDILRYYLKSAAAWPILFLAGLGMYLLGREIWSRLRQNSDTSRVPVLGPVLCLVYVLSPAALYVICLISKPIAAGRYLLPYNLALATACAFALQSLASRMRGKPLWMRNALLAMLAVGIVILHVQALHRLTPPTNLDVAVLSKADRNLPVVVKEEETFFQLQHYFSNPQQQFYFLAAPHGSESGLMGAVGDLGYYPGNILRADVFFARTRGAYELLVPGQQEAVVPWIPQGKPCPMQLVSEIPTSYLPKRLYLVPTCPELLP